jgi:glycerophosphoryl diester phosphodiesterase
MREFFGEAWERLFGPPIAHRGLWTAEGPPENSLGAFRAACTSGYGIELDVQLTSDGEAVVFHDSRLARMTGVEGRVADHTVADLGELHLAGTDETIPTLAEALTLVGHRAMVHIEIKIPYGEVGPLERRVHEILIDHSGPTSVIGFNPYSHAWFAEHHPTVLRGLNSYSYVGGDARHLAPELRKQYADLRHVAIAKPHFLALGLDMLPSAKADTFRKRGMPIVAWTVGEPREWDAVRDHCDNLIFEGFPA